MNTKIMLIVIFFLPILLAGCIGEYNSGIPVPDSYEKAMAYEDVASPYMSEAGYAPAYAPTPTPAHVRATDQSGEEVQKLIRTGSLTLEVTNVSESIDLITAVTTDYKGFVESSTMAYGVSNEVTGSMTVRMPGESFDSFLDTMGTLGTIKRQDIETTDVTEDYIDKQAQITSLTLQRDQYYRILDKAETVEDILHVQREIDRVQLELDRITGKMKYLQTQIAFGTLRISLQTPPVLTSQGVDAFTQVIQEATAGFIGMISFLFVFFVTIIPLLIIIYILYRLALRTGIITRFKKEKT